MRLLLPILVAALVQLCLAGSNAMNFGPLSRAPPMQNEFTDALNVHLRAAITHALPPSQELSKLAPATQPAATVATLPAGYAYLAFSNSKTDKTCTKTSIEVGVPANTCVAAKDFSYKIQLVTDGCEGATIQYFGDTTCTTLLREQALSDFPQATGCNAYDGENILPMGDYTVTVPLYYYKLHCTAQPSKPIAVSSATVEFYDGDGACTKYVGFSSFAQDVCFPVNNGMFSVALRCGGVNTVAMNHYLGGTCSIPFGGTPFAPTCALTSDGLSLRRNLRSQHHGDDHDHEGDHKDGHKDDHKHDSDEGAGEKDEDEKDHDQKHDKKHDGETGGVSSGEESQDGADAGGDAGGDSGAASGAGSGEAEGTGEDSEDGQDGTAVPAASLQAASKRLVGSLDRGKGGNGGGGNGGSSGGSPPSNGGGSGTGGNGEDSGESDGQDDDAMPPMPEVTAYKTLCTAPNTDYGAIVSVTQIITTAAGGYASYLADIPAYLLALQKTIADSIDSEGVALEDIFISSVSLLTTPTPSNGGQRTQDASSALQVLYTILSYSSTLQNADLAALLEAAVSSGEFDTLLQQNALAEGATGLVGASSGTLAVNDLTGTDTGGGGGGGGGGTTQSDGSSSGSSKVLSDGAFYGIIAGGGFAVLLCMVGLAYKCAPKAASADATPTTAAAAPATDRASLEMTKGMASELSGMSVTTYPIGRGLPVGAAVTVASAPAQVVLVAENVTLV